MPRPDRGLTYAILCTRKGTTIARVTIYRRKLPDVVIWDERAFQRGTSGLKFERYYEVSTLKPGPTRVRVAQDRRYKSEITGVAG